MREVNIDTMSYRLAVGMKPQQLGDTYGIDLSHPASVKIKLGALTCTDRLKNTRFTTTFFTSLSYGGVG
jgi:hypothetical protein